MLGHLWPVVLMHHPLIVLEMAQPLAMVWVWWAQPAGSERIA